MINPRQQKVHALAGTNNMNLSTIFYTVGTQAVSGGIKCKERLVRQGIKEPVEMEDEARRSSSTEGVEQ